MTGRVLPNDPPWLKAAFKDLGLHEKPGSKHAPRVLEMFRKAGHPEVTNDETAWCSAGMNCWMAESGRRGTGNLLARSWLKWGRKLDLTKPLPRGAVLVFRRGSSSWEGHVCIALEDQGSVLQVLGGNQSNAVTVARVTDGKLLGARWPTDYPLPGEKPKVATIPTQPEPSPAPLPAPVEPSPISPPPVREEEPVEEQPKGFLGKALAWLTGGGLGTVGVFSAFSDWQIAAVVCAFLLVAGLTGFLVWWLLIRKDN